MRCAPEGDECFMYQLAMDTEKNPVAEVSILKLPEEAEADAGVTVVTPLGTLLPQGVVVQIDTGEQRQYPFAWCSQVGCFARFGLARPSIDAMKRGNAGKLTLHAVAAPEQPVTLALSLTGFTAAYDALDRRRRSAAAAAPEHAGPGPARRRPRPPSRRPRGPGAGELSVRRAGAQPPPACPRAAPSAAAAGAAPCRSRRSGPSAPPDSPS